VVKGGHISEGHGETSTCVEQEFGFLDSPVWYVVLVVKYFSTDLRVRGVGCKYYSFEALKVFV